MMARDVIDLEWISQDWGRRLRVARKERGLTQLQACVELAVTLRTYQKWETGTLPDGENAATVEIRWGVRIIPPGDSRKHATARKLSAAGQPTSAEPSGVALVAG